MPNESPPTLMFPLLVPPPSLFVAEAVKKPLFTVFVEGCRLHAPYPKPPSELSDHTELYAASSELSEASVMAEAVLGRATAMAAIAKTIIENLLIRTTPTLQNGVTDVELYSPRR